MCRRLAVHYAGRHGHVLDSSFRKVPQINVDLCMLRACTYEKDTIQHLHHPYEVNTGCNRRLMEEKESAVQERRCNVTVAELLQNPLSSEATLLICLIAYKE